MVSYGVIWCRCCRCCRWAPTPRGPGRGPVGPAVAPWARALPPAVTFDTWFVIADRGQWPRRRLSEIFRSDHAKSYQLSYVSYHAKAKVGSPRCGHQRSRIFGPKWGRPALQESRFLGPNGVIWCHMVPVLPVGPAGKIVPGLSVPVRRISNGPNRYQTQKRSKPPLKDWDHHAGTKN